MADHYSIPAQSVGRTRSKTLYFILLFFYFIFFFLAKGCLLVAVAPAGTSLRFVVNDEDDQAIQSQLATVGNKNM